MKQTIQDLETLLDARKAYDEGADIESRVGGLSSWGPSISHPDNWNIDNLYYRRKPKPAWKLPEAPEGFEWHRTDGWTEKMLPKGWRPMYVGEEYHMWGSSYALYNHNLDCFETFNHTSTVPKCNTGFYRTAQPMPKLRPWTQDEVPLGMIVYEKASTRRLMVTITSSIYVTLGSDMSRYSYDQLLKQFKRADGSPCGVME